MSFIKIVTFDKDYWDRAASEDYLTRAGIQWKRVNDAGANIQFVISDRKPAHMFRARKREYSLTILFGRVDNPRRHIGHVPRDVVEVLAALPEVD